MGVIPELPNRDQWIAAVERVLRDQASSPQTSFTTIPQLDAFATTDDLDAVVTNLSAAIADAILEHLEEADPHGSEAAASTALSTHAATDHGAGAVTTHAGAVAAHDADNVTYDNATSGLAATDVQAAVDEHLAAVGAGTHVDQQDAIADLALTVTDPPTQTEVQSIADKLDALLAALRLAGVLAT